MGFYVRYIDTVIESNEPVLINRGRHGAVLVSLDEYNAFPGPLPSACASCNA